MVESVSSRAKAVVLLFVVSAILYVLISPLPEMAATRSAPFSVLVFLLVVVVFLPPSDLVPSMFPGITRSTLQECSDLQAALCSRLC